MPFSKLLGKTRAKAVIIYECGYFNRAAVFFAAVTEPHISAGGECEQVPTGKLTTISVV